MAYLYEHKRLDSGEIFYVGVGLTDDPKYKRAYTSNGRNNAWRNIINKVDYEVNIIIEGLTIEDAFKKEVELIASYGRKDIGHGTLVNFTNGGDGVLGLVHSMESRKKMSEAHTGKKLSDETKEKIRKAFTGKKHSPESIARMCIAQKGLKDSPEVIAKRVAVMKEKYLNGFIPISKLVLNKETGIFYTSAMEAFREMSLDMSVSYFHMMLRGVCTNKTPCVYA